MMDAIKLSESKRRLTEVCSISKGLSPYFQRIDSKST